MSAFPSFGGSAIKLQFPLFWLLKLWRSPSLVQVSFYRQTNQGSGDARRKMKTCPAVGMECLGGLSPEMTGHPTE